MLRATEGASTLPIAQVQGLNNTCLNGHTTTA